MLHCGLTSMGNPSAGDNHPLHGELPNAPYKEVQLIAGKDNKGSYMVLKGRYRYKVAFSYNYEI
ncbi:MAG TPA: hypothetical protein VK072_07995 [Candidatus Avamphibacillus sp.]|nr:hypothetical protein [Candidatus Avamphibacillus sp.]